MKDMVNHPDHYNQSGLEVIDIIDAFDLNFSRGSIVKYICRAGKKDVTKELEDLKKAAWYLEHEIKKAETRQCCETVHTWLQRY